MQLLFSSAGERLALFRRPSFALIIYVGNGLVHSVGGDLPPVEGKDGFFVN